MEHIVNFGVCLDDEAITNKIIEQASKKCNSEISEAVHKFAHDNWAGTSELREMFKEEVKQVIQDNKQTILDEVVKELTKNLARTNSAKAIKEKNNV